MNFGQIIPLLSYIDSYLLFLIFYILNYEHRIGKGALARVTRTTFRFEARRIKEDVFLRVEIRMKN